MDSGEGIRRNPPCLHQITPEVRLQKARPARAHGHGPCLDRLSLLKRKSAVRLQLVMQMPMSPISSLLMRFRDELVRSSLAGSVQLTPSGNPYIMPGSIGRALLQYQNQSVTLPYGCDPPRSLTTPNIASNCHAVPSLLYVSSFLNQFGKLLSRCPLCTFH